MSDTTERGLCPECGTEQPVNKDGAIRKHGTCEPGQFPKEADQPPADDDSTPADDETPDSSQAPTVDRVPDPAPQGDSGDEPDGTDSVPAPDAVDGASATSGAEPPDEGDEQPPVQDLGYGKDAYIWEITVAQPAIYLDDPAWHAANSLMAAQHATDAGHTPAGEAQCTAVAATEDGTGLTLTYLLPIDIES